MNVATFTALEVAVQAAEAQWRRGDLVGALHSYTDILTQRLASAQHALTAWTAADMVIMERLADLAVPCGHMEAADALLASMVAQSAQAGNRYAADYTVLKRVHLALVRGRLHAAYDVLQAMQPSIGDLQTVPLSPSELPYWEAERHWPGASHDDRVVLFSRLYLVLGKLLAALGQYGEALVALERGLHHTELDTPDLAQQARVPLRLGLTEALLEKGELAAASTSLLELESDLDERQQPGFVVHWLELSGKLALLRGTFGDVLAQFRRVMAICQTRGFTHAAIGARLNLAHILIYLNQTSNAKDLLVEAQVQAAACEDSAALVRARLLLRMAQARGHSLADGVPLAPAVSAMWGAEHAEALDSADVYQEPCIDLPQSHNYLAFFEDRALDFHWQLGRRDLEAAAHRLADMQQVFGVCDSALIQVRLRVMDGMLAYYQDKISLAALTLDEVRPALAARGLLPELWQVQRFLSWCWGWLGRSAAGQQVLVEHTRALLETMTASLTAADQAIFQLNKWTTDEEYIATETTALARLKIQLTTGCRVLRPWRRWKMMRRLHALLQHIDHYKDALAERTLVGSADSQPRGRGVSLWRRLWTHPRSRATLSFLVLPDRVLVTRVGWLSLDFGVSTITRLQVRDLVRRWHETIMHANRARGLGQLPPTAHLSAATEEAAHLVQRLAESLQLPLLLGTLPARVRALTVVPDDSLHGFPFAAIVHEGKCLAERYALCTAFTHHERPACAAPSGQGEALAVAVSQGAGPFVPLPGVCRELDKVKTWLARQRLPVRILVDDAAQKEVVLNDMPRAAFLHMACHGTFEPNRPDRSGMVLIPTPGQPDILSLRELSNVSLRGLRHVTLSSCWSADSFILPGRWIISLPQTLWQAGAQSVLGCLWEVDDRVAVSFMARFYDYLQTYPRDEALRRAQLDCRQRRLPGCHDLDTTAPMYWAGYTLYGDYRRLKL